MYLLELYYANARLSHTYVFMQQYQPILGDPSKVSIPFFDENADDLIDELAGIVFTQNMKSMEKYYRWVSKRYVETFGRLHKNLVDLFWLRQKTDHSRGPIDFYPLAIAEFRHKTIDADHTGLSVFACNHSTVLKNTADLK